MYKPLLVWGGFFYQPVQQKRLILVLSMVLGQPGLGYGLKRLGGGWIGIARAIFDVIIHLS